MTILQEIFLVFHKFLKFYRIFRENLGKLLEYVFVRGSGRCPPPGEPSEFFKILVEKSMEPSIFR